MKIYVITSGEYSDYGIHDDALEEIKTAEKEWAELMLMQLAESAGLQ